jgi:hypothetical protein
MKKALKITGIILLLSVVTLFAAPFLFQNKIKDMVKTHINDNLNAEVTFDDINLSFLRSFPQAYASVDNLKIVNRAPFEGETMVVAKMIAFDLSVKELFKKADDQPMVINSVVIDEALVTLKLNYKGTANYDIALKKEGVDENTTPNSSFSFDVDSYAINNSALSYIDESSKTSIYTSSLNHSGKASFTESVSQLDTHTDTRITMLVDSTTYLKNNSIKLDALIDLDLANDIYTFKDNKGYINNLPLEFNGFVKLLENGQDVDITFKNPSSSFKDFLAVIPEQYSKNLDNVVTTGDFKVNGTIKGLVTETSIPKLDINMASNNASFKYPDLPKRVENIVIDASVKNTTGNVDDTFVDLNKLNFKIDADAFKSSATIKNLTKNMLVNANVDGTLNLANISKAYPIDLKNELSGILKAKLNTTFDMNALDTNAFDRIKNNGTMRVSDFVFSSEDIVNPINISKADVKFNPTTVTLESFAATTGKSDLKATGTIKNLLGFLLSDNKLQGNFNVNSNTFAVSDFMEEDTSNGDDNKTTGATESLKIPAFLDCTINADAKTVLYDNLTLKDVKGQLVIKDQQANLQNMTSKLFDGNLAINGNVSTKNDTPTFNMDLGIDGFDISKSFNGLELFQNLAPIAKAVQGTLNTTLKLSGDLDQSFSPKLNTITGDALAEVLSSSIAPNSPVLNQLGSSLNFIDFTKLDLKDLKTKLDFKDGKVTVKPFKIAYDDIAMEVSGSHSFADAINYQAVFDVPAKYLGSDINRLIGKIDDPATENLTVPVTATIGGSHTSPKVSTDLTSGITNLTSQLIEIQKQKLIGKGKDEVSNILGGLLGGNKKDESNPKETDSTQTDTSATDKPEPKDVITEGVSNILGGLLGGKKKKKTQEKDSIKN